MRILLDEGVPRVNQKRLTNLSISTVEEMGWRAVKKGALLDLMAGEFQIIVTTDKKLPAQQNLSKRKLSAVILPTDQIPVIIELLSQIEEAIAEIAPGQFIEIPMA